MRITQTHLDYWRSRKLNPGWAATIKRTGFKPEEVRPSIHSVINANAGLDHARNNRHDVSNTLAILRGYRKRESIVPYLRQMALHPGTPIRPERRAAFCKKWLKKMGIPLEGAQD